MLLVFGGFTCWSSYGYAYSIVTLGGSSWVAGHFYLMGWYCYGYTNRRGISGGVTFSKIFARGINASLYAFTSVTSGMIGAGFFSA